MDSSYIYIIIGERDSSVGRSSTSESGDLGSNPGGGLTLVAKYINEWGRDFNVMPMLTKHQRISWTRSLTRQTLPKP